MCAGEETEKRTSRSRRQLVAVFVLLRQSQQSQLDIVYVNSYSLGGGNCEQGLELGLEAVRSLGA